MKPKARKVLFGIRPLSSDKEEKFGEIHYGLKYVPESEGDSRYAEGRWTEVGSKWSIEDRIMSLNSGWLLNPAGNLKTGAVAADKW